MDEQDARDGRALRELYEALPGQVSFDLSPMEDGWQVEFWHWAEPMHEAPPGTFRGSSVEEAARSAREGLRT